MGDYYEERDDDAEESETGEEYEFEAPQFYDFTRKESDCEIEEAERWFEVSGYYPPSPFIMKIDLEKLLSVEVGSSSSEEKCSNASDDGSLSRVSGAENNAKGKGYMTPQAAAKVQTSSDDKLLQSRTPSFMQPTSSNLAKQKANHNNSGHICTRLQKISAKNEQKVSQSPSDNNLATKRQKLDIGYLKKVAHLKHQFSLMHKSSKKVTIPKDPGLETMLRAQRQMSKVSNASSESESQKQKFCNFKARPLNKKILEPRLSFQPKKSPTPLTDFHVFHLKTMERANHHASAKVHPSKTDISIIQNGKQKTRSIHQESGSSTGDKLLESPPTELFSKISLGQDMKTSRTSQSNLPSSVKRCNPKPRQCGGHMRLHEAKCLSDISTNLDIS